MNITKFLNKYDGLSSRRNEDVKNLKLALTSGEYILLHEELKILLVGSENCEQKLAAVFLRVLNQFDTLKLIEDGSNQLIPLEFYKGHGLELIDLKYSQLQNYKALFSNLKSLICSKCYIPTLKDLLSGDEIKDYKNLAYLQLNSCKLKHIDNSIALLKNITTLDLSRNKLTEFCLPEWTVLSNLRTLDLSYNFITSLNFIPSNIHLTDSNVGSLENLNSLYVKNNHVSSLKGVENLTNLQNLDVSNNLISLGKNTIFLKKLKRLINLNLAGNPFGFQKNYRNNVILNLHSSATFQFRLDNQGLTKKEQLMKINECLDTFDENVDIHFTERHTASDPRVRSTDGSHISILNGNNTTEPPNYSTASLRAARIRAYLASDTNTDFHTDSSDTNRDTTEEDYFTPIAQNLQPNKSKTNQKLLQKNDSNTSSLKLEVSENDSTKELAMSSESKKNEPNNKDLDKFVGLDRQVDALKELCVNSDEVALNGQEEMKANMLQFKVEKQLNKFSGKSMDVNSKEVVASPKSLLNTNINTQNVSGQRQDLIQEYIPKRNDVNLNQNVVENVGVLPSTLDTTEIQRPVDFSADHLSKDSNDQGAKLHQSLAKNQNQNISHTTNPDAALADNSVIEQDKKKLVTEEQRPSSKRLNKNISHIAEIHPSKLDAEIPVDLQEESLISKSTENNDLNSINEKINVDLAEVTQPLSIDCMRANKEKSLLLSSDEISSNEEAVLKLKRESQVENPYHDKTQNKNIAGDSSATKEVVNLDEIKGSEEAIEPTNVSEQNVMPEMKTRGKKNKKKKDKATSESSAKENITKPSTSLDTKDNIEACTDTTKATTKIDISCKDDISDSSKTLANNDAIFNNDKVILFGKTNEIINDLDKGIFSDPYKFEVGSYMSDSTLFIENSLRVIPRENRARLFYDESRDELRELEASLNSLTSGDMDDDDTNNKVILKDIQQRRCFSVKLLDKILKLPTENAKTCTVGNHWLYFVDDLGYIEDKFDLRSLKRAAFYDAKEEEGGARGNGEEGIDEWQIGIKLDFDTLKQTRQKIVLFLDDSLDAQELLEVVSSFIKVIVKPKMECLKCDLVFEDVNWRSDKHTSECQKCGSTTLVQTNKKITNLKNSSWSDFFKISESVPGSIPTRKNKTSIFGDLGTSWNKSFFGDRQKEASSSWYGNATSKLLNKNDSREMENSGEKEDKTS